MVLGIPLAGMPAGMVIALVVNRGVFGCGCDRLVGGSSTFWTWMTSDSISSIKLRKLLLIFNGLENRSKSDFRRSVKPLTLTHLRSFRTELVWVAGQ